MDQVSTDPMITQPRVWHSITRTLVTLINTWYCPAMLRRYRA